ncbi:MAG TPA: hypothetical protein VM899_10910 [Rubellimicrobium sp.]|jgi:hypothetical protein|nr:hypothetical protein [Rubellimicrobium sp.]
MHQIERSLGRMLEVWPDNIALSAALAFIVGLGVLWIMSSRM